MIATVALYVAVVVLAGIGGALIASAWRGRLIGWAPTCAKCRFDLRASAASLPEKCPECGTLLAGAVDVGPRRMRPARMIVGIVLLVEGAVLAGGMPMGAARTINGWLLSMRSIDSFNDALSAGDQRAWRIAIDRVRLGSPSPEDVESLLRLVIAQVTQTGAISMTDRTAITALSQSTAAPEDLAPRVLDALASLPGAVRIQQASERLTTGANVAINASVADWPNLHGLTIQLRVIEVLDADGQPLRAAFPAASNDFTRFPRSMINTRLVRAPERAGEHQLRVIVELRAVESDAPAAGKPGADAADSASSALPDVAPQWQRRIESVLPVRVEERAPE